ncbi:dienelactone hydrolase family protein [Terrabacter carboxydivorans]|uniref:Dienelactone hydrolase family protein n=1 Tax=Terrabacter carboxydivorans TaxID=619730 RepID=A0ABN3KWN3_9MICO
MSLLSGWRRGSHAADGFEFPTYRDGAGPGVVVMHESPGLTPEVVRFGRELVDEGFTVVMPHFFGSAHEAPRRMEAARVIPRICVSRDFTMVATGRTTPVAGWLRSLSRHLHAEAGGVGVGAVGMCLTGGFALAMMVDPSVVAPVVAQPAVPVPLGPRRAADVGLDAGDLATVRDRVRQGCHVLGVRYRDDWATGTRFETLTEALGEGFLRVELEGSGHATLTAERHPDAVDAVVAFLRARLLPAA